MKALIREEGETVTEDMGIPGIEWDTGYPLTDPGWFGGPYVLVENYDPDICEVVSPDEFAERAGVEIAETPAPETRSNSEGVVTESPSTVTIDGKTYTKDELLALLNQTS